jgi:hypothetical protein
MVTAAIANATIDAILGNFSKVCMTG